MAVGGEDQASQHAPGRPFGWHRSAVLPPAGRAMPPDARLDSLRRGSHQPFVLVAGTFRCLMRLDSGCWRGFQLRAVVCVCRQGEGREIARTHMKLERTIGSWARPQGMIAPCLRACSHIKRTRVGPSRGQLREGRRRKGSFPLQGARQSRWPRIGPTRRARGIRGAWRRCQPLAWNDQAARLAPSPAPRIPLARARFICEQALIRWYGWQACESCASLRATGNIRWRLATAIPQYHMKLTPTGLCCPGGQWTISRP